MKADRIKVATNIIFMAVFMLLPTRAAFAVDITISYTYDNLSRLTEVSNSDGSTIAYQYDANGNRTSEVVTLGSLKADFDVNSSSGNAPLAVSFTDHSTGSITSRSWDFGDGGTSSTQNPTHVYGTPGNYTAKLTITGSGGSSSKQMVITVTDTVPPSVDSFTIPATSSSLTVSISKFTASDNVGVTGYLLTETSTKPAAGAAGWSSTSPATHAFATAGYKTLYAWAKDAIGNVSDAKYANTTISNLNNATPVVTTFSAPVAVNSLTIPITAFTATDNKAVTGYMITLSATAPSATATTWSAAAPATFAVKSAGSVTLYAWAKDGDGNVSAPAIATVNIDMTKPAVSTFTVAALTNSLTVPITALTATDNVAVTGYLVTETSKAPLATATGWSAAAPAGYTVTNASAKTLYAWVRDAAGNVSTSKTAKVSIDQTLPVISKFTVKSPVNSLTIPVTAFTAKDKSKVTGYLVTESAAPPAASSADWKTAIPTGYTTAAAGDKTLYAWVKDGAGNVSLPKTATTTVDTELPRVTAFAVPEQANSLTVPITTFTAGDNKGVTGYLITLTATAPLATAKTWKAVAPTTFKVKAAGDTTLYAWVKDAAGNVSVAAIATVSVDTTKPVISAFTVATPATGLTVPITVFTASDNLAVTGYLVTETSKAPSATTTGWSETAPVSYKFTSAGNKTLYAWAKDGAGNVSKSKTAKTVIPATVITSISGRVIAGDRGIAGVSVSLYNAGTGALSRTVNTAVDGSYSLAGVESGTYAIFFDGSTAGYGRAFYNATPPDMGNATPLSVSAPIPARAVNATLPAGGSIGGRVTDQTGAGIPGIRVTPYAANGTPIWGASCLTDADGAYTIPGLPTGNYKLQYNGGSAWGIVFHGNKTDLDGSDPIAVSAGSATTEVNAALVPVETAQISGTVASEAGIPLANATVRVYRADTNSFVASAVTDASGAYTIAGLPGANYKLFFDGSSQGYARTFSGGEQNRIDKAGEMSIAAPSWLSGADAVLVSGGSISGRVTDRSGRGFAGVRVIPVSNGSPVWGGERLTDAEGNYLINGLPPGSYELRFDGGGSGYYDGGKSDPNGADAVSVSGAVTGKVNGVLLPK